MFITRKEHSTIIGDLPHVIDKQIKFGNETFVTPYIRLSGNNIRMKNDQVTKDFENYFKVLKDDYRLYYYSWYVEAHLFESFQKYILELHQHGIIQYLERKYVYIATTPDEEKPKKLTLFMLSAGFYIWLITVFVALIAFIGEHLVRYFSKSRRDYRKNLRHCVEILQLDLYENE